MDKITNGVKEYATKKMTWKEKLTKYPPMERPEPYFDEEKQTMVYPKPVRGEPTEEIVEKLHYCYPSDIVDYEGIIRERENAFDLVVDELIVPDPEPTLDEKVGSLEGQVTVLSEVVDILLVDILTGGAE